MSPLNFSNTPEISVILPTYNRAKYLVKCIETVLNQTFQNWELIIVDDGSSDETFNRINPLLMDSDKIRYLKHKNRKLGYTKNAGIQASFGQYITFIDSDDQYKPEHLASRLDYMKSHPELDLIEGGFDADDDIWLADYYHPDQLINLKDCILGPTFFGKRHVFFQLNGFLPLTYAEDREFWDRAELQFKTAKLSEPCTYIYTRADDSITTLVSAHLL